MTRVVHCKRDPYDVYIGRPSKWGNPFSHKDETLAEFKVGSRDEAVDAYAGWIMEQPELLAALPELHGKVLGCWCAPRRCHGDVLVELANACENCGGDGWYVAAMCCRRPTPSGDCCYEPEPEQVECEACGGTGRA